MLKWTSLVLVICAPLLLSHPAAAESGDDLALSELVEILRAQGVLSDAQYRSVSAKAAMQDSANQEDWTDRVEAWGDFRARYEMFDYDDEGDFVNENGDGLFSDRHRFRYRMRLNVKGNVNEYADVFIRLTTGADGRNTNETLGVPATVQGRGRAKTASVTVGVNQTFHFEDTRDLELPVHPNHVAVYITRYRSLYDRLRAQKLLMTPDRDEQFRFAKMADPDTGEVVFEFEHEMRSLHHPDYRKPLVNRIPVPYLID